MAMEIWMTKAGIGDCILIWLNKNSAVFRGARATKQGLHHIDMQRLLRYSSTIYFYGFCGVPSPCKKIITKNWRAKGGYRFENSYSGR